MLIDMEIGPIRLITDGDGMARTSGEALPCPACGKTIEVPSMEFMRSNNRRNVTLQDEIKCPACQQLISISFESDSSYG